MRVISGAAKGISLKAVPGQATRPTSDKVKEAIFSRIGPYFTGGAVLDLFAGTGALGIEALSRGADIAIFIDHSRASITVIHENLRLTSLEQQAEVYRNDAMRAMKALAKRELKFHYVFIDPPYKMNHMEELILLLQEYALLHPDALIVAEYDAAVPCAKRIGQFIQKKTNTYGDTAISIYAAEAAEFNPEEAEYEIHP